MMALESPKGPSRTLLPSLDQLSSAPLRGGDLAPRRAGWEPWAREERLRHFSNSAEAAPAVPGERQHRSGPHAEISQTARKLPASRALRGQGLARSASQWRASHAQALRTLWTPSSSPFWQRLAPERTGTRPARPRGPRTFDPETWRPAPHGNRQPAKEAGLWNASWTLPTRRDSETKRHAPPPFQATSAVKHPGKTAPDS